ncbi:MAG: hypothetical protein R3E68_13930 [Burkholderiaceae bacterium]
MESTTHTALLRMEQAGYIERRHLPGNQRRQHVPHRAGASAQVGAGAAGRTGQRGGDGGRSDAQAAAARRALLAMVVNLAADERRARGRNAGAVNPPRSARENGLKTVSGPQAIVRAAGL